MTGLLRVTLDSNDGGGGVVPSFVAGPKKKNPANRLYVSSKIRIKGEAVFWQGLQYPYLCPNSKPYLRIKYILIGGDGL